MLDADLAGYIVTNLDTGVVYTLNRPIGGGPPKTFKLISSGLNPGQTYSFTVRSKDDRLPDPNESEESAVVSAQTRSTSVPTPPPMTAESIIDDNGTTQDDPGCTGSATIDDRVGVQISWTGQAGGPGVFRVYRAPQDTNDYLIAVETSDPVGVDGVCDENLNCTYFDEGVSGSVQYYVVAVDTSGVESAATAVVPVTGTFDPTQVAAYVYAVDGRNDFVSDNSRSRQVGIHWAPVAVAGLQGYHVYRKCDWAASNTSTIYPGLVVSNCSHEWQRLTANPVTGQREFTDTTTGDLGGGFDYAVRTVGPGGVEGDVSYIVGTSLWDIDGFIDNPQCGAAGIFEDIDTKVEDASAAEEKARINDIPKGTGDPEGAPAAPILSDEPGDNWDEQGVEHADRSTRWAYVKWLPNDESDLAGYHVEMAGSSAGPWKRLTLAPVAWWETRFDVKGLWIEGYGNPGPWIGPECVALRVIAVDDNGNESPPSTVQEIPEGCSGTTPTPTVFAPTNPTGATGSSGQGGPCSVILEWDRVYGATKYYVYRTVASESSAPFFYRTHTHLDADCDYATGRCQYEEAGDPEGGSSNPEHDCPLRNTVSDIDCATCALDAYYVTAVGESGTGLEGESPRSNLVFWKPNVGYARLDRKIPGAELPDSFEVCALDDGPNVSRDVVNDPPSCATSATALSANVTSVPVTNGYKPKTAPLLTLGFYQSPFEVYHLYWDHLGSTRVVTNNSGEIVSQHDFYPFGEELANYYDYNTKLFTGHERDEETGLDYMFARYYSNQVGRFLTPDRLYGVASDVQTWNRYAYVWNRPLMLRDVSGNYPTWANSDDDRFPKPFWFIRWFGRGRPGAGALRKGAHGALHNGIDAQYGHAAAEVLDGDLGEAADDPRGKGRYGAAVINGEVTIFYRDTAGNEWAFTIEESEDGNTVHIKYYRPVDGEEPGEGEAPDPPQCGGPCPIETSVGRDNEGIGEDPASTSTVLFGGEWHGTSAYGDPPEQAFDPQKPGFCPACGQ